MKRTACLLVLLLLPTTASADDWEKINTEDGVSVYSKAVEGSDLVAFKGVATIKQPLGKLLSVLMDNERRVEWVDRMSVSTILEEKNKFDFVIYQAFDLPFIISNRDYVYRGKAYTDAQGAVVLTMNSCKHEKSPETVGVRAKLIRSKYKLIPKGKTQTTVEVEIHTDPRGMIPTWLVNQIQENWPAKTLSGIRKQAQRKDVKPYPLPPAKKAPKRAAAKAKVVQASINKR